MDQFGFLPEKKKNKPDPVCHKLVGNVWAYSSVETQILAQCVLNLDVDEPSVL